MIDPALGDFSSLDFNRAREGDAHRRGGRARPVAAPRGAVGARGRNSSASSTRAPRERSGLPRDRVPARRAGFRAIRRRHRGAVQRPGGQAGQRAPSSSDASASCTARATSRSSTTAWCRRDPTPGEEPGYGLALTTRRNSWGPNYLRFGLQLQNDFEGNSSFNAAARGTMAEITKYGGEWVWDLQVGETPRVATEVYLPVRISLALVRGAARGVPDPHVADRSTTTTASWPNTACAPPTSASTSAASSATTARSASAPGAPSARRACASAIRCCRRPNSTPTISSASSATTRVDNVNFPRHGASFQLGWQGEREGGGDSQDADLLVFDQLYAHSWGRNTAILWTSGRHAARQRRRRSAFVSFRWADSSTCRASRRRSLVGPHFAIARGIYYRQVGRGGQGFLNVPVYVGTSIEVGQRVDFAPRHLARAAPGPTAACSSASIPC